jgi:hypothetical protein
MTRLDVDAWSRQLMTAGLDELVETLVALRQVAAVAEVRLLAAPARPRPAPEGPRLVTPSEAARTTGLARRWFYDHPEHPAIRRPSPGRILVDLEVLATHSDRGL